MYRIIYKSIWPPSGMSGISSNVWLNLNKFKNTQIIALKDLLLGKDVFVNQPTGSGKSLIFQAFPILFDMVKRSPSRSNTIVLVISPLVSLMQDQVSFLKSKGIRAAYIGEEQADERV